jgi:hypothetical protein
MSDNVDAELSIPEKPAKVSRRKDIAVTFGILAAAAAGLLTFQGMTSTPDARTVADKFKADSAWVMTSDEDVLNNRVFRKWTTGSAPTATPESMEAILKDSGFTKLECSESTRYGFGCSGRNKGDSWVVISVDNPTKDFKESRIFMVSGRNN